MQVETLIEMGQFIRKAREEKKLTLDALALITGISKPYLSNIETARAPGPASEEKLRKIATALDLSADGLVAMADWLRTPESVRNLLRNGKLRRGDGVARGSGIRGQGSGAESDALDLVQVPVINKVAAGSAKEFTDLDYPAGVADEYVELPKADGPQALAKSSFAVRVSGDSMAPEYREGDLVVVKAGAAEDGDDCLVRLGANEGYAQTFKRVYFESDTVRLVPLNKAHPERTVKLEEVTGIYPVVYKVVAIQKKANKAPTRKKYEQKLENSLDRSGAVSPPAPEKPIETPAPPPPPPPPPPDRLTQGFSLEND